MFEKQVYTQRREKLRKKIDSGLILLPGNSESSMNYPSNTFLFRQDSSFLYFFGLNFADLVGVLDVDSGKDYIFGDDLTIDDIVWTGPQPTIKERSAGVGVENTAGLCELGKMLEKAIAQGRKIHFLPPYRGEQKIQLEKLLGIRHEALSNYVSEELIVAVVALRSIKEPVEIEEIERMVDVAYDMHTTAMRMAQPGRYEREITGVIEGIARSGGGQISFPVILSKNGQTLHNHYHGNRLAKGDMLLTDAGAESEMCYASDITRTSPVGGKFLPRQREIYQIVLNANQKVIEQAKPGVKYKDVHLSSAKVVAQGLKDLGLLKGDVDEMVNKGVHALFYPHGLGHMMGLDVHDMEGLGENYVGYDAETTRSSIFGLAALRLGRRLQTGFVLTNEPGTYFIPELIDQWRAAKKFTGFINYDKVEEYRDFGGIRIEDDLLITDNGCRVLGKPIPKTIEDVEKMVQNG